jgi:hypothetical protein
VDEFNSIVLAVEFGATVEFARIVVNFSVTDTLEEASCKVVDVNIDKVEEDGVVGHVESSEVFDTEITGILLF